MAVSRIDEAGLNVNQYGNRNLIINGAMQVWQRGTTSANNAYGADRWKGSSVTSQAQSTDVPNASFAYSNAASGSGGTAGAIGTPIELQVTGKSAPFKQNTNFTFSGFVKGTSGQKLQLRLRYRDGMFGANSQEILAATDIVTFDGTWQYVTKTVDFGSSVDVVGTSKCLELLLIHNTADATWYQTGCQFEVGDTATDFEHRSYADELAKCMRYCLVLDSGVVYGTYGFVGFAENSTTAKVIMSFPVHMRSAPALTRSGSFSYDGASGNPTISSTGAVNTPYCSRIEDTVSGATQGQGLILINNNDSDAKLTFDAEL